MYERTESLTKFTKGVEWYLSDISMKIVKNYWKMNK